MATGIDRLAGVSSSVAIKAPCHFTTTGNITLSGLGTQANGTWPTTLTQNDDAPTRILVKDQTNPIDCGIWNPTAGTWQRAKDFDGARDVVQGTLAHVYQNSVDTMFQVTTANPIVIGATAIAIVGVQSTAIGDALTRLADSSSASNGATLVATSYDTVHSVGLNLRQYVMDDGLFNVMGFIPDALKSAIRDGTSTTDVTQYVKYAYAESPGGIRFPVGRFNFDQTTQANQFYINRSNTAVRGSGPGTQLRKNATGVVVGNQAILQLFPNLGDVENVEISDLRITGPEAATGGAIHGDSRVLAIACHDGSSAHVLRDVLIRNVIGEKIESAVFALNGLGATGYCERIKFLSCVAQNSRQDGYNDFGGGYNRDIEFNSCIARLLDGFGHEQSTSMGLRIIGGLVANCGQSGIGLEFHPTQSLLAQVDIIGVTIRDIYTTNYPDSPGISLGQAQNPVNVFIRNNTIQRTGGHGIKCNLVPNNVVIEGNRIQDVGKGGVDKIGMFGFNGTNIKVLDNVVTTATAGYAMTDGIAVQGNSATNRIAGNEISGETLTKITAGALCRAERNIQPVFVRASVGNIGAGEDDLLTYSVPARTIEADNQYIVVKAWGTTAANANNKQVKLYWGASQLVATGALAANNKDWYIECIINRLSSTVATSVSNGQFNGAIIAHDSTNFGGQDWTLARIIKCTGEATTTDDIIQTGMSITYMDSPSNA